MNFFRCNLFLLFATMWAFGQAAPQRKPVTQANQPETLVRSLYTEVVARHPVGIPEGPDKKMFGPYLSTALLHRIDVAIACAADYDRQYPDPNLKPTFAWLESGIFSGGDERSEPQSFRIERTESEKDGSFRVYVRLTWGTPPTRPWMIWEVVAIVVPEGGHYVLDDVIYLKDKDNDTESRLSDALSAGCDGSRWVGKHK